MISEFKKGQFVCTHDRIDGFRRYGHVIARDGLVVYVKLLYKDMRIERYPNELEIMKRQKNG